MKKTIHVFDVDGTIIYGDSLLQIWQFIETKFWRLQCQLISILPYIIIGQHQKAKEKLLAKLLKGKSKDELDIIGNLFFEHVLKYKLKPKAVKKIIDLNEKKIEIVLLSASCDMWLKPLAAYLSAALICTEIKFDAHKIFNGHFATPNCKSDEKVRRLLNKYSSLSYEFISYGDSKSDKKLIPISKTFYYRYF